MSDWLAAIRRAKGLLAVWMMVCLAGAVGYLATTTPEYIASARLSLHSGYRTTDGPDRMRLVNQIALGGQQMQTQIELIRSHGFLRTVFDAQRRGGPVATDAGSTRSSTGPSAPGHDTHRRAAFDAFERRVYVRREGLSYVIEIAYRAPTPDEAANTANSISAAYVRDRLITSVADLQTFTPYLKSRIETIVAEEIRADSAMRTGLIPDEGFPDAGATILGPAVAPVAPAYPHAGPTLLLAGGFGAISGLVVLTVLGGGRGGALVRKPSGVG